MHKNQFPVFSFRFSVVYREPAKTNCQFPVGNWQFRLRTNYFGFWFGEDQARYVVTVDETKVASITGNAGKVGVSLIRLGVTGGDALTLSGERPILISALTERFEGWLPRYMAGGAA